jgi:hypothetical protein
VRVQEYIAEALHRSIFQCEYLWTWICFKVDVKNAF